MNKLKTHIVYINPSFPLCLQSPSVLSVTIVGVYVMGSQVCQGIAASETTECHNWAFRHLPADTIEFWSDNRSEYYCSHYSESGNFLVSLCQHQDRKGEWEPLLVGCGHTCLSSKKSACVNGVFISATKRKFKFFYRFREYCSIIILVSHMFLATVWSLSKESWTSLSN